MPDRFSIPYPFNWERRYASLAVPVLVGKQVGEQLRVYTGIAAGVLMTTYSKAMVSYPNPIDENNRDGIYSAIYDSADKLPAYPWLSADIVVSYQLLKTAPRFSIGAMLSMQLLKTGPVVYQSYIANTTANKEYTYHMEHRQRVTNYAVLLSYRMGKIKGQRNEPKRLKTRSA